MRGCNVNVDRMRPVSHWHSAAQSRRYLPLDLLRGYCLIVMTIDHVGMFPTWVQVFTGAAQLWVTAAEGFFMIAGITFGIVYQRHLSERGATWTMGHLAQRAGRLYVLSVIGHWLLTTGDFVLRLAFNRRSDLPVDYGQIVRDALLQSRVAPGSFDMLALYALLLPLGLGALALVRRGHWRGVLIGSIGLWYVARLNPTAFTPIQTYFNVATWQVIFVGGLIVGVYREPIGRWWAKLPARPWRSALLIGSAIGLLIVSYQIQFGGLWPEATWLRSNSAAFDRPLLGPARLVAAMWVSGGVFELITVCWQPIYRLLGWLLLPLGQHTLTAFTLHSIITYGVTRLPGWPFLTLSPMVRGLLQIAVVGAVWIGTRLLAAAYQKWPVNRRAAIEPLRGAPAAD